MILFVEGPKLEQETRRTTFSMSFPSVVHRICSHDPCQTWWIERHLLIRAVSLHMVFDTFLVLLGVSMKICWAHLFYMGHFPRAVVLSSSWKFGPSVDPAAGRLLSENVS